MSKRAGLPLCKRRSIKLDGRLIANDRGFSLVEVVVAIVVISIMILAIFRVFTFSSVQNKKTNELDELYTVAERSMEHIKSSNMTITANANYQVLTNYSTDTATLNRFTVIYKVQKLALDIPDGEADILGKLPTDVVTYNVDIEVYFSKDGSRLGSIGKDSKVSVAHSLNIPIILLNSQLTKYQ